ncbi:MAG TPA: hypothetical protein VIO86_10915 [Candidatus Dormibacteraeota bacterium]|jgi:hypothetical protein
MCAGHEHPPRKEGNPASFYRNIAGAEGSLAARLLRATLNILRRAPRRAGCCGNYGEPGC